VPVDWNNPAKPEGAQAQLAVIRIPATGDRIGVLVVNPGGPGASAVDTVASMGASLAGSDILRRFDLVGIDRAGSAIPRRSCAAAPTPSSTRSVVSRWPDYSQAGVAHIEGLYSQFRPDLCRPDGHGVPRQCRDRVVGTRHGHRARRAWREPDQLSRLLVRNQLGAAYAERYGDRVRAMVLDGAVDPSLDPIAANIHQMAGFQTAFNDYAADCAQSAGCPLGTDPAKFVDRFHQLVDPLVAKPGGTSDPRGLGYQDAMTGTVNALYARRYWQYLTSGLLGLQRGTDAGDLLLLADDYQHRDDSGHYQNLQDAFTAIRCGRLAIPNRPCRVGRRRSANP